MLFMMVLLGILYGVPLIFIFAHGGFRISSLRNASICSSVVTLGLVIYAVGQYHYTKREHSGQRLFRNIKSRAKRTKLQSSSYDESTILSGAKFDDLTSTSTNNPSGMDLDVTDVDDQMCAKDDQEDDVDADRWVAQSQACFDYDYLIESNLRLLQIEHSEDTSLPISAAMIQLPLLSARQRGYTALSYTWGTDDSNTRISINGAYMDVRPNLEKILRALWATKCGLLWVDAICINQSNIKERNAQVLRMRGILAGAQNVVVAIEVAESDISKLSKIFSLVQPSLAADNQDPHLLELIQNPRILSALKVYCHAPYWQRVWILQEFSMALRIDLLVGETFFGVRRLYLALELLHRGGYGSRRDYAQPQAVFDIRRAWRRRLPESLLDTLIKTSYALCKQPHDRVFGILGLVSDALDFLCEPDYGADVETLAVSMTSSYIQRRSIDIIILAQHMYPSDSQLVPSWCPGFFWFRQYPPDSRVYSQALRHHERLVGNSTARNRPNFRSTRNWRATGGDSNFCTFKGTTMSSPAHRIGTIRSAGSAWTDQDDTYYPCYDAAWAQARVNSANTDKVARWMVDAMLDTQYSYKVFEKTSPFTPARELLQRYFFIKVFLPSHDNGSSEESPSHIQRWIRANRKFFVGGQVLAEHAIRNPGLPLAAIRPGLNYRPADRLLADRLHADRLLKHVARNDMRMMCLDDDRFGIGWATKGAELQDEVFLLPGCSVPLILRHVEGSDQYRLVGDAIVIGAMENEVWSKTQAADLVQVDII